MPCRSRVELMEGNLVCARHREGGTFGGRLVHRGTRRKTAEKYVVHYSLGGSKELEPGIALRSNRR